MEEDHRTKKPDVCGITITMSDGCEWMCVRKIHDNGKDSGPPRPGETLQRDRHYMVPVYPQREEKNANSRDGR